MWHLIGIRNKKDWQRGEERLKELGQGKIAAHKEEAEENDFYRQVI